MNFDSYTDNCPNILSNLNQHKCCTYIAFSGPTKAADVDPKLFIPLFDILFPYLPEKIRKPLRMGIPFDKVIILILILSLLFYLLCMFKNVQMHGTPRKFFCHTVTRATEFVPIPIHSVLLLIHCFKCITYLPQLQY